jgi:Protein of unknown function (DUF2591)
MRTSELVGPALDWAVAKCEGLQQGQIALDGVMQGFFNPSTNWAQGGPIIERTATKIEDYGEYWGVECPDTSEHFGPTILIAGLRTYVASKLGYEIEIPEELK